MLEGFHRWVSSAKPRSPRQRTERISAFRAPGTDVQLFDSGRLLHRDMNAVTSAFITRVGQHQHGIAERPQHAQHVLPGRAARSCTLPGSTSDTHSGTPDG
jgi:hypothetical protein